MQKIINLALVLAIFTLAIPFNTLAAEEPAGQTMAAAGGETTAAAGAAGGLKASAGAIAAAASVLAFIALAASIDSGDATPIATTTHH
jgi:hypothetical protein